MAPDLKIFARKSAGRIGAVLLLALGLAGCIDTLEQGNSARRPLVNAPGVPVALVSLDGAPPSVTQRFETELGKQASRRQIMLVQGSETPRYRLKGYLSAYDVEGGTNVSWVWDMYDTTEKRARRVDGAQLIKRNAAEPWSTVDDDVLLAAASSSMNEVASYLSGAPSPAAQNSTVQASQTRIAQAQIASVQAALAKRPATGGARATSPGRLQSSAAPAERECLRRNVRPSFRRRVLARGSGARPSAAIASIARG